MLIVFFVDLFEKIIPDVISIPFTLVGIILSILETFIPKLATLNWQSVNINSYLSPFYKWGIQNRLSQNTNFKFLISNFPFLNSIFGIAIGYFILLLIAYLGRYFLKKEAMGGGDIKLAGMIGSFLGWKLNAISLYFSFILGGAIALILIIFRKKSLKDQIAFGPEIILGALLSLLYGEKFLNLLIPIY